MHAIEMETEIDHNRELHLKLPAEVQAGKARVVVLYDDPRDTPDVRPKPVRLGLFCGQIQMSDDFDRPLTIAAASSDAPDR